jgi:hypothetical protein
MRRYAVCFILLSTFLLAACGGGETPAPSTLDTSLSQPTSQPSDAANPTSDPNVTPPSFTTPVPRATIEGEVPLPAAGTLVSVQTGNTGEGILFSRVILEQEGGVNNTYLAIELKSDGTLTRWEGSDPIISTVGQEAVTQIDDMLDKMNFFGVQGTFVGPSSNPETYFYTITVELGDATRQIRLQDGYLPAELEEVLVKLRGLGLPSAPGE